MVDAIMMYHVFIPRCTSLQPGASQLPVIVHVNPVSDSARFGPIAALLIDYNLHIQCVSYCAGNHVM